MKNLSRLIKLLVLCILPVLSIAQNKTFTITPELFKYHYCLLANVPGWESKMGRDSSGGEWKTTARIFLDPKKTDQNGRIEAWFKLRISIDSQLNKETFFIRNASWAAADVYINNKQVFRSGNTGAAFKEHNPHGIAATPVNLKAGPEYTVMVHIVDRRSPWPPHDLQSADIGIGGVINLGDSQYNTRVIASIQKATVFNVIWITTAILFGLLFGLIYLQNKGAKDLAYMSGTALSLGMLTLFSVLWGHLPDISYKQGLYIFEIKDFFNGCCCVFAVLLIAKIFKRPVNRSIKIFLGVFFVYTLTDIFLDPTLDAILTVPLIIGLLSCCTYFIVSSWKTLKGAQWAVIVGAILSFVFVLVYYTLIAFFPATSLVYNNILISGYTFSFLFSLMVYMSMRFREIITEVRLHAGEITRLSEEKRQEAITRQQVLQAEVDRQTSEIRAQQQQLIQSEKMASLGELTAGIAHEIQNPLNFVNNFSEVSRELMEELKEELDKGNSEEVGFIANDVIDNLGKINHHGKRADSIVKGMLEHSRTSSGQKEPTDINKLTDEYLRLAYHGSRAKDKAFTADLITNFDEHLPKANILSQDIARVLLNLFTNAFYAVNEKKKTAGTDYKPTIVIATAIRGAHLQIVVKDNGPGIPDAIKDKIMQPFFTTKPTGQGTGLGLSLSYDIVVKGHAGNIFVNSVPGEGAEFIIELPLKI